MNEAETIEALCDIVEQQNDLIRRQADALEQLGAACAEEEIREINELAESYIN